jgi:hypothetical protein
MPAARSLDSASAREHDVTMVHEPGGSAASSAIDPGSGTTPSVSSISPRSTTSFSAR